MRVRSSASSAVAGDARRFPRMEVTVPATPVVDELNGLLADSTVFYQKLRHYHWNVEGRHFFELHAKFEELYTRWAEVIDQLAERILMVDGTPLHTLKSLLSAARLSEDESVPAAPQMVEALASDLRVLHERAGALLASAEAADDRGTANLMDDLRDALEKDLWMLRTWMKETAGVWN
jgi:starvation-inducible DNA-binding protein